MDAIAGLRERGWLVEERPEGPLRLPQHVADRYPALPGSLRGFLDRVASCVNPDGTAWLLCEADFSGTSGSAYRWDGWELLSLEAAADDARWSAEVRGFWDDHLPFLFTVGDGYGYYAVRVSGEGFGEVVTGRGPEFEQSEIVAESFEAFMASLLRGAIAT